MAKEHLEAYARRVVVGPDDQGRSTILSDANTVTRLATEALTRNVIWGADVAPTPVMADTAMKNAATIPPPLAGYYFDISTFPPDSEWGYEGGYAKALAQAGVGDLQGTENAHDADGPGAIARMHQTDTVDIVTVISVEIWAVVETGETLVRAGDTVIQRGTWHAWRNRSDAPCTVAAVHISVVRYPSAGDRGPASHRDHSGRWRYCEIAGHQQPENHWSGAAISERIRVHPDRSGPAHTGDRTPRTRRQRTTST